MKMVIRVIGEEPDLRFTWTEGKQLFMVYLMTISVSHIMA
jgi:hypothetical protein